MKKDRTGEIGYGLYWVGEAGIPVFVLDGDRPALFDAGFACMGNIYADEIEKVLVGRSPAYLFLTHVHFDHCGAVSVLKKRFPSLEIIGSERARKIIGRPNALDLIRQLNLAAAEMIEERVDLSRPSGEFEPFEIHRTVGEGDVIDISSDLTVQVLETPGHTRDCLSYYIPGLRALISSEAAGIADQTGYIFSEGLVDYGQYVRSLERLARLDVDMLCPGHNFVYTGVDAGNYLRDSLAQSIRFREIVERMLSEENENAERVKARLKRLEYDGKPAPKQPEPAYLLNLDARVNAVRRLRSESAELLSTASA